METREDSLKRQIRDLEVELGELRADLAEEQARKEPIDLSQMPQGTVLSWTERWPGLHIPVHTFYAIRLAKDGVGWRIAGPPGHLSGPRPYIGDRVLSGYLQEKGITEVRASHVDRWAKINGSTDREEIHMYICGPCDHEF